MKNILSLAPGTKIKGKEIKEWILCNIMNETFHSAEARSMTKYLDINNDEYYEIRKGTYQVSWTIFQVIRAED